MNVNTLEFWIKVKGEYYSSNSDKYLICYRSATFAEEWRVTGSDSEIAILKLADEFLHDNQTYFMLFDIGTSNLFSGGTYEVDRRMIRTEFIDWCISKFS